MAQKDRKRVNVFASSNIILCFFNSVSHNSSTMRRLSGGGRTVKKFVSTLMPKIMTPFPQNFWSSFKVFQEYLWSKRSYYILSEFSWAWHQLWERVLQNYFNGVANPSLRRAVGPNGKLSQMSWRWKEMMRGQKIDSFLYRKIFSNRI